MAMLVLREVNDDLYDALRKLARAEHRSVPSQAVHLLEEAVHQHLTADRRFETARRLLARLDEKPYLDIDTTALIREDRER